MILGVDASGLKNRYLYRRGHNNPVPVPHNPLWGGFDKSRLCHMALDVRMCMHNEHVVAILKHANNEAALEDIDHGMEVAQHGITAPPTHETDIVWVHPCHEECHCPSLLEGACAYIFRGETYGGSGGLYNGAEVSHYCALCLGTQPPHT